MAREPTMEMDSITASAASGAVMTPLLASASRQSTHSRAMMLTTGSTTWPAPSGIMWASGGSSVSILSTIMVLISPMVWFSTLPSGAWRNRSASRSRSPSRMVYAMAWDVPVDRPNSTTLAA